MAFTVRDYFPITFLIRLNTTKRYFQDGVLSLSLPQDWYVNPKVLGEFYERFKDTPKEEIKEFSFNQGLSLGKMVIKQIGIKGNDEKALAALLTEVLKEEPTAKILHVGEGKVLLRNSGFCPLMTAALSLDLPWTWLCEVLGWPFFHGLASAINPKVNLTMIKRRAKGDPYCDHLFELEGEGKLFIK